MKNMIFDKQRKTFVLKPNHSDENCDCEKYHLEYDLIGSPEYLSPEVILGKDPTEAVDFWALGCIVYLFFHGETPFKDKYQENLLDKIRNCEYTLRNDLDPEAKDLIIKLLEFDPKKRLNQFINLNKKNRINNNDWKFENKIPREQFQNLNEIFKNMSINTNQNKDSETNFYSDFITGIKSHQFFKHIDFKNLQNTKVPIDSENETMNSFNGINNNINDLSIFNSANNNMNFGKNNFNNLYSPEKANKGFINKNSHENIIVPPVDRMSNASSYTNNTSDPFFHVETNDDKSNLNLRASFSHGNHHNKGALPFKFDKSLVSEKNDRINLESEIYSNNNSFLIFLQDERKKSKNRLKKFHLDKCYSENFNIVNETGDENIVVLEGKMIFY